MNSKILFIIAITAIFAMHTQAQDSVEISRQIERLSTNSEIDEATRAKATAVLLNANTLLASSAERAATIAGYVAIAASAPKTLQQIRNDVDALEQLPPVSVTENLSDSMINSLLVDLMAERNQTEATLQSLSSREESLNARAEEIATEISQVNNDIEELRGSAIAESTESDPLVAANRILYSIRLDERHSAVDDLATERATLAARQNLVAARINLARKKLLRQSEKIQIVQTRLNQSRTVKAKLSVDSATKSMAALTNAPLSLQTLAQQNIDLARTNLDLVQNRTSLVSETLQLTQELTRITSSAQTVEQVLATGQLNDETAKLLRNVRVRLPNTDKLTAAMVAADQSLVALRLNLVLWQDRLRNLASTNDTALRLLTEVGAESPSAETVASVLKLIDQRREFLQALIDEARTRSTEISDQRLVRQNTVQRATSLASLLDRRLLWLPTKDAGTEGFGKILASNAIWMFSISNWRAAILAIVTGFSSLALIPLLLALLALALLMIRKFVRHRIISLGEQVGSVEADTYLTTPDALIMTVLYALPLPIAFSALGLAAAHGQQSDFADAVSQGLFALSTVLFILLFFRSLACKDGVFHRHFGWSEASRLMLRRHLFWFMVVESSVAFVFTAALTSGDITIKYGIGRLVFMLSSVAIAVFSYYVLKPQGGIASIIDKQRGDTSLTKILFVLLVAAPLIIGVLPITGYYEAAIELQSRVFQSGVVIVLAAVIYRFSLRLLMVGQRRLTRRKQLKHMERQLAKREAEADTEKSGDATPSIVTDIDADVSALSEQSYRAVFAISIFLLALGLWATWRSLMPAFGAANDIVLWNSIRQVDGIAVSTGITLWDIAIAVILIVIGLVTARNINGILELVVFERFTLDSGTRYAVATIAKYVLISLIVVIGLSSLGLDWSSLQWVIAALGVGLGFGLQEIVANFVSGLIILFERPVRVGDIVTIGQLEGTVTSIQIRATRITDFDNREVLLPNKSIITDNVTNWTLNDQVTRIIIRVGVAYGSDIDQVRDIFLKAVSGHPDTLSAPNPVVFFMAHGDSSLNFEARVFVATPAKRLPVTHDLNRAINLALKEHNIEIPFPQRDIHMRTAHPDGTEMA